MSLKEFLKITLEPLYIPLNWFIGILISITLFVIPITKWGKNKRK